MEIKYRFTKSLYSWMDSFFSISCTHEIPPALVEYGHSIRIFELPGNSETLITYQPYMHSLSKSHFFLSCTFEWLALMTSSLDIICLSRLLKSIATCWTTWSNRFFPKNISQYYIWQVWNSFNSSDTMEGANARALHPWGIFGGRYLSIHSPFFVNRLSTHLDGFAPYVRRCPPLPLTIHLSFDFHSNLTSRPW